MLKALAEGETDAARLAAMADPKLQATHEPLQDALHAAATLSALPSADSGFVSGPSGTDRESDGDPGEESR